jgi:PST family polysaccharide transporter
MSIRSKILSSSIWLLAGNAATMSSSFVIFALLARLLTPADFGLVAFASVFIEVARRVMFGGFPDALVQRKDWDDTAASTVFWINLASSVVLAGLLAALAAPLAHAYGAATFAWIFSVLSISLVIDALRGVHEARLRRDFGYKILAIRMVVANVVAGTIGIALAVAGLGVWALVGQRLVASTLQTVIVWRTVFWIPKLAFSKTECVTLGKFGVNVMGAGLLGQLSSRVPDFVIGIFLGPAALGLFRVGSRTLYFLIQLTIMPIQATAFSAFSRLSNASAVGRAYLRLTSATAFVSFPVFLGAASVAPDFVVVCFGSHWEASGPVMTALALVVAPATLVYFAPPALAALGRSQLMLLSSFATFVMNALAALVTVSFGVVAVAAGQVARAHVTAPFALSMLQRGIGLPIGRTIRSVVEPGIAAALMAATVVAARLYALEDLSPLPRLAICVVLGAVVYASLLLTVARRYTAETMLELTPHLPAPARRVVERFVPEIRHAAHEPDAPPGPGENG